MLHVNAARHVGSLHGVGDLGRYEARMAAVEYAMEHDDGQSLRASKRPSDPVAPSRCGKTPTTMYLALQHGIWRRELPAGGGGLRHASDCPRPGAAVCREVFRPAVHAARLSQVRGERRPGSRYASLAQCGYELRRAEAMYRTHGVPVVNSSAMSVEEIAAMIMQTRRLTDVG